MATSRAAFTIAVGKPIFIRMAISLARSFQLWNADNDIEFTIVTDRSEDERPSDLTAIRWKVVPPGSIGHGFTPKLYLDQLAPADKSLFIDADSLCVRSLEPVFDRFAGNAVSVIGENWSEGEWFGDVAKICKRLGLSSYPFFNGGVYYIEPGETATQVFNKARELREDYDAIGFARLRDRENDEVLISTAMAMFNQQPVPQDGSLMNSLLDAPAGIDLDVVSGRAVLYNPPDHPNKARGHSLTVLKPAIVHMNDLDIARYPYVREELKLDLICKRHWPVWLARAFVFIRHVIPSAIIVRFKSLFRPLFHKIFGPRKVAPTSR